MSPYYCNLSPTLINASSNAQKGDLFAVAGLYLGEHFKLGNHVSLLGLVPRLNASIRRCSAGSPTFTEPISQCCTRFLMP
jgi:hypothetical protein